MPTRAPIPTAPLAIDWHDPRWAYLLGAFHGVGRIRVGTDRTLSRLIAPAETPYRDALAEFCHQLGIAATQPDVVV